MKGPEMLDAYPGASLWLSRYQHGGLAVWLNTANGSPLATISVWIEQSPSLPAGQFFLKDWSENAEIVAELERKGVIVPVPDSAAVMTGFCMARVYKISPFWSCVAQTP